MLLGIDIGGTTIKVGLCTPGGKILSRFVVDTPSEISREATEKLTRAIANFASESIPEFTTDNLSAVASENPNDNIEAIGIAVPGIVDANNEVHMTPNIKLIFPISFTL